MPSNSKFMLLDNRTRLKCKYKYINFYCEKVSDIVVTFRNYVIAELNRIFTLATDFYWSTDLIFRHCAVWLKSVSTFLVIKVEICIVISLNLFLAFKIRNCLFNKCPR
jgi:hypothetical protein